MRKSTDGGATFQPAVTVAATQGAFDFPVPSMETRRVFIYVAVAADLGTGPFANSIYAAWTDATAPTTNNAATNHARIQVAYSRDGGATWTVVTPHETADANTVDRWHPWLAVGSDGVLHLGFYDTRNDPNRQSVDFYYTRSTDGGQSWSVPERVTTVSSPNISTGFEFGDYNGLDVVMSELIAIWTDNREDDAPAGGDDVDVYSAKMMFTTLPVELASVEAVIDGVDLILRWETATETNNAGFEIQHTPEVTPQRAASPEQTWQTLAFVEGYGTSTAPQQYSYRIPDPGAGRHRFRLKQIDFDGTSAYSPELEVTLALLQTHHLSAAYPNPFNPQARFTVAVQQAQPVTVEVVDLLGRRVALLHEGELAAHTAHPFEIDGSAWASGTYLIQATGSHFKATRQVTLTN